MKSRNLAALATVLSMAVCGTTLADQLSGKHYVKMETTLGNFVLELDADAAPGTVANFLGYVEDGFYEGTMFHRVIKTFMIQGGGMTPDYARKETKSAIQNEADNGLPNSYGTIAMARTGAPHSATSQFFINVKDNSMLNHTSKDNGRTWGYCVFGAVVDGIETVEAIRNTPVHMDRRADGRQPAAPDEAVVINKAEKLDASKIPDIIEKASKLAEEREKVVAAAKLEREKQMKERAAEMAKVAEKVKSDIETGKQLVAGKSVDISKGVMTESGLWYVDAVEGDGETPPDAKTRVRVHYTGWHVDGRQFDSSRDRGQPSEFGLNQVIAGWTEGVGSMKVGSRRYLVIPPKIAYGERGRSGIPGNSVLVFDVELLAIVE